ncbi:MAG: endopeptidase La [Acidimicrobiales bacterium]
MESDTRTLTLPLLPLHGAVVFPGMVMTMGLESPEARAAWEAADPDQRRVVLVTRLEDRFARVGTVATLDEVARGHGGSRVVGVRAEGRVVVGGGVVGPRQGTWVEVEPVEEGPEAPESGELADEYRRLVEALLEERGAGALARSLRSVSDPGALADTAGYLPELSMSQRVELLETVGVEDRLRLAIGWVRAALQEAGLARKLRDEVAGSMERSQRELLLRQQLAAIRKELGEDRGGDGAQGYQRRLEAASGMPEAVRSKAEAEIERLERTGEASPEHGWIRTWLDTVFDLPWEEAGEEEADPASARAVLDSDHSGLDEVKDRIVEHLAVRRLRSSRGMTGGSGAILALVGPPGVGKTSLGASIAKALGRGYARVSLGGIRDEAEIRGHRRTYVGAMAGRIVRALTEAGSMSPVMVLDEVDKLGSDWRGDPSAALLEVLDQAQNHSFFDHYLDFALDLSRVVFLATANVVETIPAPLLDRLEVIRLDGYTEAEKLAIARDHLLPRVVEAAGLSASELVVDGGALRALVAEHTNEAGVRDLERQLARIARKVAAEVAADRSESPLQVGASDLRRYLGKPRPRDQMAGHSGRPGVATGLAVTGSGGDVLEVEAAELPDGGPGQELTLTGQLGDVMSESARIALSYVRGHASQLGLPDERMHRWHVHVPAGAVPKDGPSAGVTMVTALASLAAGRPVRPGLAMTGEVSLGGRLLAVGGIKQKLLAAVRAGMTDVLLPEGNAADVEELPAEVREHLAIHLAGDATEAVALALSGGEGGARNPG